ncbi:MAG: pilus assembly protein PilM [Ruminococcus flavefaciens]|nr:pilus assembly protein PilM [Ruminococcus flavefaciens]MCM1229386.1 pilus assembly protein PilM [Ruminococcus flavefaciens]
MLSFDITDRNIRVVKGVESNGKIKISSAATLNVDEGLIVNGHVKDIPNIATLINKVLKNNKMPDKEAIVSLSSNLTIFKELTVAKPAKSQDMQKAVKQQMQSALNLDDSFSITYAIVGDADEKGDSGEAMVKVLATACPYEIVNSYREVFKLLGISLKSVMVGCNCITKVLLADTKIKTKMPLLAVQIDNNFISLNLYEQGQLSFSRFASIDPADYNNSPDYVFEAVNENIFRMLQFHRTRNTGEVIENIIFYGDTHDYVRLTDELEKLDLSVSLINVPPQIHGHENLEFSLYANAIGAMFKRNKDTEKINLLETELGAAMKRAGGGGGSSNNQAGLLVMLGCVIGAAVIAGGAWLALNVMNNGVLDDIDETQSYIDAKQPELDFRTKLLGIQESVNAYNTKIVNARDAFYSQPVINSDKYMTIQEVLDATADELSLDDCYISTPSYSGGTMNFSVNAAGSGEMVQKLPSLFIDHLIADDYEGNKGYYHTATYSGYSVSVQTETIESTDEDGNRVSSQGDETESATFSVTVAINGRESAYKPAEESGTDSE